MTLYVRSEQELERLLSSRERKVVFAIEELSSAENEALHAKFGVLYEECGCTYATVGLLIGVVLGASLGLQLSFGGWSLACGLFAGAITSLAAKAAAVALARRRLHRLIAAHTMRSRDARVPH